MIIFEPLNIKINKPIKDIRVFDHNTGRILKISKINFSDNTVLVNYGSGIKRWKKFSFSGLFDKLFTSMGMVHYMVTAKSLIIGYTPSSIKNNSVKILP